MPLSSTPATAVRAGLPSCPHALLITSAAVGTCAGTAALLNTVAWVESSDWDGRYGIVVAGDIAVYEPGPARATGGVAAVAFLVGPQAPLTFVPRVRTSHVQDVYDFYKPHMGSEVRRTHPHAHQHAHTPAARTHTHLAPCGGAVPCGGRQVESSVLPSGPGRCVHTVPCCPCRTATHSLLRAWLGAACYNGTIAKLGKARGDSAPLTVADAFDYLVFHAPYNKLVQQSFQRILFNDARTLIAVRAPCVACSL